MRTTTWTEVQEDIRQRYDLPAFSTTTFITTAAVLRMANQSLQRRDALLAEAYGDDYRSTTTTLATQADLNYISLPADFLKLHRLIWLRGTNDSVVVERADADMLARLLPMEPQSWGSRRPYYRFEGTSTVQVLPTPNQVYSLTLIYTQTTATLTTGGDTIQDGPAWTEWLVADVCVKIAQRFEDDPSIFMAERQDAEARIRRQAPQRDETQSQQLRDVEGLGRMGDHERREWLTRGDW